jgi:amidophosphoribosyltransferase
MGGFFGVVSNGDCVRDVFYGTDYHSHLGTKRGGIAVSKGDGRFQRRIHDISNSQFRSKFDAEIGDFEGNAAIGIISDTDDQPLVISGRFGVFAIVTVGKINNIEEIAQTAFDSGHSHLCESGDGELNPTEIVAMLICRKDSITEGLTYVQNMIEGSCSVLLLQKDRLYVSRDKYGRTPCILGKKDGSIAVTMESSAFPNLDYKIERELGPGEIVEITHSEIIRKKCPSNCMKICSFFWVYYGYPSSCYEGVNTEAARYRNGESLVEFDKDLLKNIDSICGIPDSGIAHAIGYSNAACKPYHRSFVKYTPTWPRSFMPQNQRMRELVAKMKLIPVESQIRGKRLLFCDDSIVRGTQLKDTVGRLYEAGAKEVHMRSACPPLLYGCKFLNFSRSRTLMNLAARRAVAKVEGVPEIEGKIPDEYLEFNSPKYKAMVEEIRKELNLSTLKFQSLNNLLDAIGIPRENLCTYCWNGKDVEENEK